ncbi:MAG: tRNA uridine(34) 5-carboxymethylaminomethyl modification radical SAM/GNAT enzyme Elp3, partial [Coriobacteriaceae bacterium]|nr:tRNA uridine(34) 5-carboxymethylaminomethyl modification radical SAM/GNAT enzyme Elp3 [Coriobacteriaceae bacterium]
FSKKRLLPYYLKVKEKDPGRWSGWAISPDLEKALIAVLQVKPRRTASGVATITVVTKPWGCSSDCLYCPNDLRMPKSYLHDEPACQRAERNCFDPYLQVASRLRALMHMGHTTDKVELIILGGTWNDYPPDYQLWFVKELFRALNESSATGEGSAERRRSYRACGLGNRPDEPTSQAVALQQAVDDGSLSYNQALAQLYGAGTPWESIASWQKASFDELSTQQAKNEASRHRAVGLVVETRPDLISPESLLLLRRLGCTKVQMGIQSLDPAVLGLNDRKLETGALEQAFELLRAFGFKIHVHFMVNLYGSNPEKDKHDYLRLVSEAPYQPDEVKLYPCSLVKGTRLCQLYDEGDWQPYREDELLGILANDVLVTPPFIRISRMIRDISAHDIIAGNKKANLRQMVERMAQESGAAIAEIRHREIGTEEPELAGLSLDLVSYRTSNTHEHFLQWVTPRNRIAGFLRLSLPDPSYLRTHQAVLPVSPSEAMIREVHVYGRVAGLQETGSKASEVGAQHLGLGKQLIEAACDMAKDRGFQKINVISAVGTREYYRNLGFKDNSLYQQKELL